MALPVAAARAPAARAGSTWRCSALRLALLAPLAGAYTRRGAPFWLSPLADPATAVRLTLSALRPRRDWRGRTYRASEQQADQAHQPARRHHVLDGVGGELDGREREHAGAGAPLERRRRG